MAEYILEMNHNVKAFSGVRALDDVNFKVRQGEIMAICGENGAGKSTLMNVLSGVYPYGEYTGDIVYKGDYAFERSIIAWGTATGVMITGMMLLKICDPDYETPALADFSMGFSLLSLSGLITTPLTLAVFASGSTMANFLFSLAVTGVFWAGRFWTRSFASFHSSR